MFLKSVNNFTVIVTLLLLMFILSGIQKMLSFTKTVESVQNKLNMSIPYWIYQIAVIIVIIIEIIAPAIVIYYSITNKMRYYAYIATLAIIIFTIVVTFVYHPPDFSNYYKSLPFWANVSLTGGLLLLVKHLEM